MQLDLETYLTGIRDLADSAIQLSQDLGEPLKKLSGDDQEAATAPAPGASREATGIRRAHRDDLRTGALPLRLPEEGQAHETGRMAREMDLL